MSNYIIEKSIPILTRSIYPFNDMQIGDSFAFPKSERVRVAAAASNFAAKSTRNGNKMRFMSRRINADTCRIWRVEAK